MLLCSFELSLEHVRLDGVDERESGDETSGTDAQSVGGTGVLDWGGWAGGRWRDSGLLSGWGGWVLDLTVTLWMLAVGLNGIGYDQNSPDLLDWARGSLGWLGWVLDLTVALWMSASRQTMMNTE